MNYPNKIFLIQYTELNPFGDISDTVRRQIMITASDKDAARKYLLDKFGIKPDAEPIWIMGAVHQTIYVQDGSEPEPIQAKILFRG